MVLIAGAPSGQGAHGQSAEQVVLGPLQTAEHIAGVPPLPAESLPWQRTFQVERLCELLRGQETASCAAAAVEVADHVPFSECLEVVKEVHGRLAKERISSAGCHGMGSDLLRDHIIQGGREAVPEEIQQLAVDQRGMSGGLCAVVREGLFVHSLQYVQELFVSGGVFLLSYYSLERVHLHGIVVYD